MEDFGLDHRAKENHCWMLSAVCVWSVDSNYSDQSGVFQ